MGKNREEIIQGIEENYLNMPYNKMLWLRLEFMMLCEDEIEALILRVVEYEIEGARQYWLRKAQDCAHEGKTIPEEPEHWWVTLSYKQFQVRLYGAIKNEKTIINKLNVLIKTKQFILRRKDPNNEYGAPQYSINKKVVQEKLDALPALPSLKDVAKSAEVNEKTPVPASGTPPTSEENEDRYQLVVPPVPASGTPGTSDYYPPVPASGTALYQLVVPVNNSNKLSNNNEENKERNVTTDTAHADVSTTAQTSQSDKASLSAEITQDTKEEKSEEVNTPTQKKIAPRRSVGSGKGKQTSKDTLAAMLHISEIAAPQKPDPATHPYNVEMFMKLGDYYRGTELTPSTQPNSRYQKALKAAMSFVQRKIEFERVDKVFCFMSGRGVEIGLPDLKDVRWIAGKYNTDLWTVESNFTNKWLECVEMEKTLQRPSKGTSASTTALTHDEAIQLAADALAQTKQHGYSKIQATAYHQDGRCLVKVVWEDGNPLSPIKSREDWNKAFKENYEMDQEDQKGAK